MVAPAQVVEKEEMGDRRFKPVTPSVCRRQSKKIKRRK